MVFTPLPCSLSPQTGRGNGARTSLSFAAFSVFCFLDPRLRGDAKEANFLFFFRQIDVAAGSAGAEDGEVGVMAGLIAADGDVIIQTCGEVVVG